MKKAFSILLILSVAFMAASCKTTTAGPTTTPEWLNEVPPQDFIWGIGTAKLADSGQAIQFAENAARVSIARQLDARVQSMMTDYFLSAGNVSEPTALQLKENVSRTITNMNVSGATPLKRWEAPDGTWWALVQLNKADAKNQVTSLWNQEAAFAQFKAQQALDMLDAQLAKNEQASGFVVNQ